MKRDTIARALVEIRADGSGINEDIVNDVDASGEGIERVGNEHGERYEEGFEGGFFQRIRARFQKGLAEELQKNADRDGRGAGGTLGNGISEGLRERLEGAGFGPLRERLIGDIDAINERLTLLRGKLDRARTPTSIDHLTESLREARSEATRLSGQLRTLAAQEAREIGRAVSGNRGGSGGGRDRDTLGDTVGGLFGAGSRNNGLNVFGKTLGLSVDLVNKLQKSVKPLFQAFTKGFAEAGEGATFLQKALSGFGEVGAEAGAGAGKAFGALIASGPAAGAAVAAIVVAMSILVSVTGAALAIVTALAATIASALVGALAVAGAGIFALVAAGGLLVAAFKSMTDAQKEFLKTSFAPIKAEFVGLGQTVFSAFTKKIYDGNSAIEVWSSNIQKAIALAGPLASVMGKAFAEAGNALTASFSGAGFQRFTNALTVYLPGITTNLSSALGSFLNGLLGTFSAILPYVLQFSDYLARTAATFDRFANKPSGQNAISDFVGRALASLQSLWGFIHQFSGLIADVLFNPQSQAAGNSLFDGLARSFETLRQKFAGAAADGSLQRWFNDAITFGGQAWEVIKALGGTIGALYNSGVLQGVGNSFSVFATVINSLNTVLGPLVDVLGYVLPLAMASALGPVQAVAATVIGLGEAIEGVGGLLNKIVPGNPFGNGAEWSNAAKAWVQVGNTAKSAISLSGTASAIAAAATGSIFGKFQSLVAAAQAAVGRAAGPSATSLINTGRQAIAVTTPKQYVNPYTAWANSIMRSGPSVAAQVKAAISSANKKIAEAIKAAADSANAESVKSSLASLAATIRASASQTVESARSALNSAAQTLAGASSAAAAKKALAQVKAAQKAFRDALKAQDKLNRAADLLAQQRVVSSERVQKLLSGADPYKDTTLADYARAREKLAVKINAANQKLADAISLRDQYKSQVVDSIKTFGDLTSAQAQDINGVAQALTAGDVTANLQTRLDKIKKFTDNLKLLLAQGLSNDAYKQLVDAGVDGGSDTAAALVAGGQGAVAQVNDLTSKITDAANGLGTTASNQLYGAGVAAAQGLVDGLTSLDDKLADAAEKLGKKIAKAIKAALGIKSPSTVMRDMMGYVGDGAVLGLDDQGSKLDSAANRFASRIAVSPEVAAYAASQGQSPTVSGNGDTSQKFRDLIVQTPTEDPHAVAMEVLNEVTGRLP